jgi:hypothetical protein
VSGVGNHYLGNKNNWSHGGGGLKDKLSGGMTEGNTYMAKEFSANHRTFGHQMAGLSARKEIIHKNSKCSNINLNIKEMQIVRIVDCKD